jgi:gag-polyprotein putative aspartyl protease
MRPKLSISELFGLLLALSVVVISAGSRQAAGQQPLPRPAAKTSYRQTIVPIERSPHFGAILVTVHINGKPAVLILDTGSNTTILSPEISGLNPTHLPRAEPPRKGTGFVGDGRWGQATLTIGTMVWKDKRVLIVNTEDLSRAVQRKIDGILGQDILDEFKYVEINFEEKRLTLSSD